MKFSQFQADVFVPSGAISPDAALARTTHLCIAAHQDDIEIMAYHGIAECFGRNDAWFSGVVVTNGAGSPRTGLYSNYTDDEMAAVRREEQRKAAFLGGYSIQIQLGHPSSSVRDTQHEGVRADLRQIVQKAKAKVVYLHQPADKHETHLAVLAHSLSALRELPESDRPEKVFGCEVWRDLDWMCDRDKQRLDVSAFPNLAASLVGVFDSQISGGKRYDLATAGRRLAHATYHNSHTADQVQAITWAMDLSPLVRDPTLSLIDYTREHLRRFENEVETGLRKFFKPAAGS